MDNFNCDWDEENIKHVAKHGVAPEEAEEVILGDPLDVGFDVVNGEERWSYLGETNEGRILRVVITMRGARVWMVTAFEPSGYEQNFYLKQKAGLP